jgi:hypothetical protein
LPDGDLRPVQEGVLYASNHGSTEFQQQGMIFHSFDFWWERGPVPQIRNGARQIYPSVCARLIAGMLELAKRYYPEIGFFGLVDFEFRFEGVRGLLFWDEKSMLDLHTPTPIIDDAIAVCRTVSIVELQGGSEGLACDFQKEMYWTCGIAASLGLIQRDFS